VSGIAFIVPGSLEQLTGGYLFDSRVIEGLRAQGRAVKVIELAGRFPEPDETALAGARAAIATCADGGVVVIDGLALLAFLDCFSVKAQRLAVIGFVHHVLADETGLSEGARRRVAAREARLLRQLRGVICPSAATASAVAAYGVPADRIAVAPPGTAKPTRLPRRRPARGVIELLTVATVTPRKGHLLLLQSLAAIADRPWRCRAIGSLTRDPATAATLRYEIGQRGLKARFLLAGEWPPQRLGEAYAAADGFVLASYHEGYGMALAEALAHGLPVIATTAGAIPDTVPASAGLLVPPGDGTALTLALARFLDEPKLRAALAAGARAAAARHLDWPGAVAGWARALDRLVAS
jgi:glycosyltransferase involved in cell wall biosynthesis